MNFASTNKFETSEYFGAKNAEGQLIAEIIRTDAPTVPSNFYGYRMLKPGVGGKSQSHHLRRFGPFSSFEEAQKAIEDDFSNTEKTER